MTLVELVVSLGTLGTVAGVAAPQLNAESLKARIKNEALSMLSDTALQQELYKSEHGTYLAANECPSAPSRRGANFVATCSQDGAWADLHLRVTTSTAYCTYATTIGRRSSIPMLPEGFSMPEPRGDWFFVVATCPGLTFVTNSVDAQIQQLRNTY
jgi:type II secretory pathway pseudopilin PulG